MPSPPKAAPHAASSSGRSLAPSSRPGPWVTVACAWLIPGAGHFLQGHVRKAVIFGGVLLGMFVIGLASSGRLFAFDTSDPLVFLAAVAQWMLGFPRLIAAVAGWGPGVVTAITYEYGNTFLITAGLLNVLVVLDAYDRATGRRPARVR
jgi:hypothetical protein